jgi:hypothetical protein
MSERRTVQIGLIALIALVLTVAGAQAAEPGKGLRRIGAKIDISDDQSGYVVAGGARVTVSGRVAGDLWLAGADVSIDGPGVGGVFAAGAEIKVGAPIKSSTTLIGSKVSLRAPVAGDTSIIASSIDIGPEAIIGGQVKLYGHEITYAAKAADRVTIEGDEVVFSGEAKGNVRIEALKITLTETAKIDGNLEVFTIGEPQIEPGAKIGGTIEKQSLHQSEGMRSYLRGLPLGVLGPATLAASALLAGLFLLWLGRGGVERVIDELIDSPGSSSLWGLATMILLPLAAGLLALTVFGLPVGLLALLAAPFLLLLGFASSGFGVGEWLFNRLGEPRNSGQRALQLLAGLIVLVLVGLIPYAGPVAIVLACITGLGALLRSLHDGMRARQAI